MPDYVNEGLEQIGWVYKVSAVQYMRVSRGGLRMSLCRAFLLMGVGLAVAAVSPHCGAQDTVDLDALLEDIGAVAESAEVETPGEETEASPDVVVMDEAVIMTNDGAVYAEADEAAIGAPADVLIEEPAVLDLAGDVEPPEAPEQPATEETASVASTDAEARDSDFMEPEETVVEMIVVEEPAAEAVVVEETVWADEPTAEAEVIEEALLETSEPAAPADVEVADMLEEMALEEGDASVVEVEIPEPALDEAAQELARQTEVRRQAKEEEALQALERGYQALRAQNFAGAIEAFKTSLSNLPERPQTRDQRERARWGMAEAQTELADRLVREDGDLDAARLLVEQARANNPEQRGLDRLARRIDRAEARAAEPTPVTRRPEYIAKEKTIDDLLAEARQYYIAREYRRAEELYTRVLLKDEYNVEAMRYLRKIDEVLYDLNTVEREATVANMLREVRERWNPPVGAEVQLPEEAAGRGEVAQMTGARSLQSKMENIVIPSIEFRQANINDVVSFLVEASLQGDPKGEGVNIILNLNLPDVQAPAPAAASSSSSGFGDFGAMDDPFATAFTPEQEAPASFGGSAVKTITLNLRRISLLDAIKYITEVAGLKYRIEDNAVIITPLNAPSGRIITRMYRVQPTLLDVIVEKEEAPSLQDRGEFVEMGGGTAKMKRGDVKDFFEKAGVPFPAGSSITYNPSLSQLIVANTAENLDKVDFILQQLNDYPKQVEIEARFVEVTQSNLEELGLEWILTDNWEVATHNQAGVPPGGQERIQVNRNLNGVSQGLRFFSYNPGNATVNAVSSITQGSGERALGGIMSISSILTNPEVTMVLHALDQQGSSDLLSAPRVTTRSGQQADIRVVREIIYPTEFDTTQPQFNDQGNVTTPPVVTPGSFHTRETGVILSVTPTVGPDNYTIDLTLIPEVSELVDWLQYGSAIGDFVFNIPQPIFSSRKVQTTISIFDGETVVMGGLIREDLVTTKDKVPILGDIPLLGYLFRSEGEYSRKQNLLIFVTARIVDPAGKPVNRKEFVTVPDEGMTTEAGSAN